MQHLYPLILTVAKNCLMILVNVLRLLLSKVIGHKTIGKISNPCHVGIHWKALTEYSLMSTYVPGFQSFFRFWSFCFGQINHQQHKGLGVEAFPRKCFFMSFWCCYIFHWHNNHFYNVDLCKFVCPRVLPDFRFYIFHLLLNVSYQNLYDIVKLIHGHLDHQHAT